MFNNPSSCSKLLSRYWRYPSPWPANFLRSHRRTRRQTCQCTIEHAEYFYQVVRYVERNALRANLVARAECWLWSSLRRAERDDPAFPILSPWPLPRPTNRLASSQWHPARDHRSRLYGERRHAPGATGCLAAGGTSKSRRIGKHWLASSPWHPAGVGDATHPSSGARDGKHALRDRF
jgi:hypothetical protein